MEFDPPLESGVLIRRYKRFLADVRADDGREFTIHCPNTGAMTGCAEPGTRIWFSRSTNKKRKYAHTWEIGSDTDGDLIVIHSARANALVRETIDSARLEPFEGVTDLRAEVALDREAKHGASRFDFVGRRGDRTFVVEVKSVTLKVRGGGAFPDAVSTRARRHVDALAALTEQGYAAMLCFAVLHTGIDRVRPAVEVDPDYASALGHAIRRGVEVVALRFDVSPRGVRFDRRVPFEPARP